MQEVEVDVQLWAKHSLDFSAVHWKHNKRSSGGSQCNQDMAQHHPEA